jgi:hypothetical protein
MLKKISLRKALQVKKNLAGEVGKVSILIGKFNSQRNPNKHVKVLELVSEYETKVAKLMALKVAIAQANVGVYGAIIAADELKSQISFYEGLNTEENGEEYKLGTTVPYELVVAINYGAKTDKVKALKVALEAALEAIDAYNSTHYIEIEE